MTLYETIEVLLHWISTSKNELHLSAIPMAFENCVRKVYEKTCSQDDIENAKIKIELDCNRKRIELMNGVIFAPNKGISQVLANSVHVMD